MMNSAGPGATSVKKERDGERERERRIDLSGGICLGIKYCSLGMRIKQLIGCDAFVGRKMNSWKASCSSVHVCARHSGLRHFLRAGGVV